MSKKLAITPKEIKKTRERLGLTQEQYAKVFDVSLRTIIRWENGTSVPQGPAKNKAEFLLGIVANETFAKEIREAIYKTDGLQILKGLLEIRSLSNENALASLGGVTGGIAALGGLAAAGSSVLPGLVSSLLPRAPGLFALYKLLAKLFKDHSQRAISSDEPEKETLICMVCGKFVEDEMYICDSKQPSGLFCNFVTCRNCIYLSKEKHTKHFPSCIHVDVPVLKLIQK